MCSVLETKTLQLEGILSSLLAAIILHLILPTLLNYLLVGLRLNRNNYLFIFPINLIINVTDKIFTVQFNLLKKHFILLTNQEIMLKSLFNH